MGFFTGYDYSLSRHFASTFFHVHDIKKNVNIDRKTKAKSNLTICIDWPEWRKKLFCEAIFYDKANNWVSDSLERPIWGRIAQLVARGNCEFGLPSSNWEVGCSSPHAAAVLSGAVVGRTALTLVVGRRRSWSWGGWRTVSGQVTKNVSIIVCILICMYNDMTK